MHTSLVFCSYWSPEATVWKLELLKRSLLSLITPCLIVVLADDHSLKTPSTRSMPRPQSLPSTPSVGAQVSVYDGQPSIFSQEFSTGSHGGLDDVNSYLLADRAIPSDDSFRSRSSRG